MNENNLRHFLELARQYLFDAPRNQARCGCL